MRHGILGGLAFAGLAAGVGADTLTVGPHGRYATIGAAVDAALAAGGRQTIKVERGLYRERVQFTLPEGRTLELSGGWNRTFSARSEPDASRPRNPTFNTVIDGLGAGAVVGVHCRGHVALRGFVVTGGGDPGPAALGVSVNQFGAVEIEQNLIWGNRVVTGGPGRGIVSIQLRDSGHLVFQDNQVLDNSMEATTAGSHANGGVGIFATDRAVAEVRSNRFLRNQVRAPAGANMAALDFEVQGEAHGWAVDNTFAGNGAEAADRRGCCIVRLGAEFSSSSGQPRMVADRNQVYGNQTANENEAQLDVVANGGFLQLTNTVVAEGKGNGIDAGVWGGGEMYLTNLTVTGHSSRGISTAGVPYISNTLFFDNGTDLVGGAVQSHNLFGVDPRFLDAGSFNYALGPDSPAIDAGDNDAPWGFGTLDVYGGPRAVNGTVDIGADEAPYLDDGAPSCRVISALNPDFVVDATAPICRCVSEPSLRTARCGFLGPDVFVNLRIPLAWKAGEPVLTPWTIHPWLPVEAPYDMSMEAKIGDKWVPQSRLGPSASGLKEGQLVVEPFELRLPAAGRTPLRTTFTYRRLGAPSASKMILEIVAGDPYPQPN